MTLHWWMHWFWVTVIHLAVILANPLPSTTQEPLLRVNNQTFISRAVSESSSVDTEDAYFTEEPIRHNFRVAKAIGVYPNESNTANVSGGRSSNFQHSVSQVSLENATRTNIITKDSPRVNVKGVNISSGAVSRVSIDSNITSNDNDRTSNRTPGAKKDSKVTWILTTNKTGKFKIDEKNTKGFRNLSIDENEDLTVLPLQEEGPRFKLVVNRTKPISSSDVNTRTFNRSDDVEIDEELAERQVLATAASVLQVVSESTRLSRARNTFTSDFHRNQEQENDLVDNGNDDSNNDGNSSNVGTTSAVDIAAITGSCLATVLLLSTMGSLGFIMYRRRYLNPPQTLNSDKCSNPDSSGYIDDSTIRDNSEEMYSLDNDSFLNSLEAMTIQNYWTDSVKHTKL